MIHCAHSSARLLWSMRLTRCEGQRRGVRATGRGAGAKAGGVRDTGRGAGAKAGGVRATGRGAGANAGAGSYFSKALGGPAGRMARMQVIRMMADLKVDDVEEAKGFYTKYLGLSNEEFNLG